jgi:hypothetical protein
MRGPSACRLGNLRREGEIMLEKECAEHGTARRAPKRIQLGARVRVADAALLAGALRGPAALRPEPGQMLWSGRTASVTGYRLGADGRPRYMLSGAPGLWLGEWIDPV